ncbi:MetQ/NlpA family ABC transporter substrate-binding protein [Jeotgalibacillus soli]|uniref:Lipoprotein n=1 Tax=Jeotgalibacillus soli TaxID=889306 RepID=A0A0C2QX49_9BACL|nr:MetQ/NlpA family ABC transporter substrate-binding protein [Jeotgalibacillus soli]KIL42655.1 methionine-binding lipoprotein metQ precursor [Jeotgalibacillus soli]
MKKWLATAFAATSIFALAACGSDEEATNNGGAEESDEPVELVVGASNVPHGEILEEAKPLLAERGIDLQIELYQDYIFPNTDLDSGEIDANYFQHVPYLNSVLAEEGNDYDFVNAGAIHIEPIAVYSQKYDSLDELPDGATILMRNAVGEHGRILSVFEEEGLIKLDPEVDKVTASFEDIIENPKNLNFEADYEASLLVQLYENNEGDAVVINSNYAIDAGLSPINDSIAIEKSESPYANIITVRAGDENREEIKTLVEVLTSEEIQDFINEKYEGSVIPVTAE